MTILYIDDDLEDHEVFKDAIMIVAPHTTCFFARDGKEGFHYLNNSIVPPDYIFLDINMPEMDGKEFLTTVKNTHKFQNTAIVMYSTSSNPVDIDQCKQLGAVDFIVKPNTFSGVCDILKRFI